MIADLRPINAAFRHLPMRMATLSQRALRWNPHDWFVTVDVSAAFLRVYLPRRYRRWVRFATDAGDSRSARVFEPCHSIFGFKLSPFACISLGAFMARALERLLASSHCAVQFYVDDGILSSPTKRDAAQALVSTAFWMHRSGLQLAMNKLEGPSQSVSLLGRTIESVPSIQITLPADKSRTLQVGSSHLVNGGQLAASAAESLIGTLVNVLYDVDDAWGVERVAGFALFRGLRPDGFVQNPRARRAWFSLDDSGLRTWSRWCLSQVVRDLQTRHLSPWASMTKEIWVAGSDASDTGVGGFVHRPASKATTKWFASLGSIEELQISNRKVTSSDPGATSSTLREASGLASTIDVVCEMMERHEAPRPIALLYACDNQALIYSVNKQRGKAIEVGRVMACILAKAREAQILLFGAHVPRERMTLCDSLSRLSSSDRRPSDVMERPDATSVVRRFSRENGMPF